MKLVAGLAFLVAGAATTIYGPLVPTLREVFAIGDHQLGLFFTVQSGLSVAVGAASGLVASRCGVAITLSAGYALIAAGAAMLLGTLDWPGVLFASGLIGVGLGLVIPTTNVFFAQDDLERGSAAVTLVNLTWGLGAFAWPIAVRAALPEARLATVLLAVASVAVAATLWGGRRRLGRGVGAVREEAAGSSAARPAPAGAPVAPAIVFFAVIFLAYGGVENSLGGWLGDLVRRGSPDGGTDWLYAPSAFYLALAVGRIALLPLLSRASDVKVALSGLMLASAAQVGLVAGYLQPVGLAVLAGLGLAAIFPVSVAVGTRTLGSKAGLAMPPIVSMSGIGGAIAPWLVGLISAWAGSLAGGLRLALGATLFILAAYAVLSFRPLRGLADDPASARAPRARRRRPDRSGT